MEAGDDGPLISEPDYRGTLVTCTRQCWEEKVEANHPELAGRHEEVAEVIRDPHFVFQDRDYGNRQQHYRLRGNGLFVKAVVEYRYDAQAAQVVGRVVTAFVQDGL